MTISIPEFIRNVLVAVIVALSYWFYQTNGCERTYYDNGSLYKMECYYVEG